MVLRPQEGKQLLFLTTPADIAIYGGAAGGGKTWALLLEALRHIKNPRFGAVIFRETYKQIMEEGGMWDEASHIYPSVGGVGAQNSMVWRFKSGAKVSFSYLASSKDKYQYLGAQIPLIAFDQLERLPEDAFWYMLGRNRSMCGVKPYIRATCNPDPDCFLAEFLSWWIGDDGYPIEERSGVIRYFVRVENDIKWYDSRKDAMSENPGIEPKSFTFIPSKVSDNKMLLEKNPSYMSNLQALSYVDRMRLLHGNWKIRIEGGKLFNRDWFQIVDAVPAGGIEVRFFDFAATEEAISNGQVKNDPDYTAGVLMRFVNGMWYVMDCKQVRYAPVETDKWLRNVVSQDMARARINQVRYSVGFERERGASGKRDAVRIVQMLAGVNVKGIAPYEDKYTRAKPFAAQAEAGNVKLLHGAWNEELLNHLHNQPAKHDDIMDACSGAFTALTEGGWSRTV